MRIKLTLPAPPEGYYQEFYDFLESLEKTFVLHQESSGHYTVTDTKAPWDQRDVRGSFNTPEEAAQAVLDWAISDASNRKFNDFVALQKMLKASAEALKTYQRMGGFSVTVTTPPPFVKAIEDNGGIVVGQSGFVTASGTGYAGSPLAAPLMDHINIYFVVLPEHEQAVRQAINHMGYKMFSSGEAKLRYNPPECQKEYDYWAEQMCLSS